MASIRRLPELTSAENVANTLALTNSPYTVIFAVVMPVFNARISTQCVAPEIVFVTDTKALIMVLVVLSKVNCVVEVVV